MNSCESLPLIIEMSSCHGDWDQFKEAIYKVFSEDMVMHAPYFRGYPVHIIRDRIYDGKERSFWHVISDGKDDNNRLPDMRRCERIPWLKPLIQGDTNCQHYLVWAKYHDKTKRDRWYIWCKEVSYLVILEDRTKYFKLITAFCVKYEDKKRGYLNEYKCYIKTKAPIR